MVRRSLVACLVVLSSVALPGCRETTAAARALGSPYVLRSLDGNALPALEWEYMATRYSLAADTLTFYDDGRYSEEVVSRLDSVGTSYSLLQSSHGNGGYTVLGDSIRFTMDCPMGALCILPPVGWLAPDGSLTVARLGPAGPLMVKRFTSR